MKNRLILIEGIPGSGKSTIAGRLKNHLEQNGINAILFREGDAHPVDMAWNAYIPMDEYERLVEQNKKHEAAIRQFTQYVLDGDGVNDDDRGYSHAIVAYTNIGLHQEDERLLRYFENHEVYDGRVSLNVFKQLHFNRWKNFAEKLEHDQVAIFECSFLQNHVNELMAFHGKDEAFITEYLQELAELAAPLNPRLVYLSQPDIRETISRVAKERLSPDRNLWPDWIDRVVEYVENSGFGKQHGLKGFDGMIRFFETRKSFELAVLNKLPMSCVVVENSEYDWEDVFDKVVEGILSR